MEDHRSRFKGLSAFGGFKVKGSGFLSLKDKGERLKVDESVKSQIFPPLVASGS
jgi:hypothetical protein